MRELFAAESLYVRRSSSTRHICKVWRRRKRGNMREGQEAEQEEDGLGE